MLSDRLLSIIHELEISQSEFARIFGITFTYVNLIVNNKRRRISGQMAHFIQEKYGYSAAWLLTGKGDRRDMRDINELLDDIYRLPPDEINMVFDYILRLEDSQKMNK
jgi:transcriptional regulator with XRE-family HTH domain